MSVQALAWVLDHSPTTGTDRLVLIALANHAGQSPVDGAWECWPGIATITREAGLARERTTQEALARLCAAGALVRTINAAPDSRMVANRKTNLYRMLLSHGVPSDGTPTGSRGDAPAGSGVTRQRDQGCREAAPKPSVEPSVEPNPPQPPHGGVPRAKVGLRQHDPAFARFWDAYPNKRDEGVATRAWRKAVLTDGVDPEFIIAAATAFAAAVTPEDNVKYPGSWLNAKSYNDPPPKPFNRKRNVADSLAEASGAASMDAILRRARATRAGRQRRIEIEEP